MKCNNRAEAGTENVMRWIISLALIAAAAYAFRLIFLKLS